MVQVSSEHRTIVHSTLQCGWRRVEGDQGGKPREFRSRMAVGKKLFRCRAVSAFRDRNLLPEGSISRRRWPGCVGSAMILLALLTVLLVNRVSREGKGQPITLSAERISRCSLTLSLAAAAGNQMMMPKVMMDSMMAE